MRPRNPARQAAEYRREGLRALAVLLEEAGQRVLESGKSERVAGGVLRLKHRRASKAWLDGKWRDTGASVRLVWTGPRMPGNGPSRPVVRESTQEATID